MCNKPADVEVILYDIYVREQEVFYEQDDTCGFLCFKHMAANEAASSGERRSRGHVIYPYSNQRDAQGFTIYRPLADSPDSPRKH